MTHRNSLFDHEKIPRELSGDILEWFKGSVDKFPDLQELIYAFIRGPDSGRQTLLPVLEKKPPLSSWSWDILPQNSWAVGFGFMKRRAIYPVELKPRERYSRTQKIAAVEHYLTHGGCLSYTRRAIGYPSNEILKRWD